MSEHVMRSMTVEEMRLAEKEAARMAEVRLREYLCFPTADNFDGLLMRLREYQTAWLHVAANARRAA